MRKRMIAIVVLVGAIGMLLLLGALLSSTRGSVTPAATTNVTIFDNGFTPSSITINVGDTVTWSYTSGASLHTVTSTSGPVSFNSGTLHPGDTFSFTFNTAGSYTYRCNFHPSMVGSITVASAIPEFSGTVGILAAVLGTFALVRYATHRHRHGES